MSVEPRDNVEATFLTALRRLSPREQLAVFDAACRVPDRQALRRVAYRAGPEVGRGAQDGPRCHRSATGPDWGHDPAVCRYRVSSGPKLMETRTPSFTR